MPLPVNIDEYVSYIVMNDEELRDQHVSPAVIQRLHRLRELEPVGVQSTQAVKPLDNGRTHSFFEEFFIALYDVLCIIVEVGRQWHSICFLDGYFIQNAFDALLTVSDG